MSGFSAGLRRPPPGKLPWPAWGAIPRVYTPSRRLTFARIFGADGYAVIPIRPQTINHLFTPMNDSTKNQIEGNAKQASGKAKEVTGKILNKPGLEARGQNQQVEGKVQEKVGQIQKVFEE